MAINMSSATIDDSHRSELLSSNVDTSLGGGVSANTYSWREAASDGLGGSKRHGEASGADAAGITADFVSSFTSAMSEYKTSITSWIDQIEAVDSGVAFKGSALQSALSSFILGVKSVATSYINALEAAENQIVQSVEKAYAQQDTDISGNLNTDAGNVESSAPTIG